MQAQVTIDMDFCSLSLSCSLLEQLGMSQRERNAFLCFNGSLPFLNDQSSRISPHWKEVLLTYFTDKEDVATDEMGNLG